MHDGAWMPAIGVRDYETAYNAAGILDDDAPPTGLLELASRAAIIAASDLPRAIASARRLAPDREPALSPLLRELFLEPPRWIPFRLPIELWDAFSYVQWSYRLARRSDNEYVRRASDAADWILQHVAQRAPVLVVTHGGFRRILSDQLIARGWRPAPGRRTHENWSTWSYLRRS